jgi:hypothetical protein
VAAAAVARGRVEDARSDHGAQSRLPQRLAPEAPSSVVWACGALGNARPHEGIAELTSTFGIDLPPTFGPFFL